MFSVLIALASVVGSAQTFDVYRPKAGTTKAPIVMFVHGGAWISGAKAQYRALGAAFVGAGLCAAVIDYHLAPEFKHPRPVEDLETARRALVRTPGPGCDGKKIALVGHSAGAHAIAYWAAHHADPVVALIGLEGIYDLPRLAAKWPTYPEWFLNAAFGAARTWPAASPTRLPLKSSAPWLLIHSTGDELVDSAQTTDFAAHLSAGGRRAETYDPGALTHFEVVGQLDDAKSSVFERVTKFVKSHAH